jgi:hypothetical protein
MSLSASHVLRTGNLALRSARHRARGAGACHSISIGFNLAPVGPAQLGFRALTYFSERVADRMAI